MKTTITLELSTKQARLLDIAVQQEMIKGQGTFLSGRDILDLGKILDQIRIQTAPVKESA